MSDNQNPSLQVDPASAGTMAGMMRMVLRKFLQSTDGMLPATVVAVDAARSYATVQPVVQVLGVDGTLTSRAQIAKVPIFNAGAGGFVLSFPVKPGDLGWIVANDRDISLYLQAGKEAGPNTQRLHSFEDGVFFPDAARQFALNMEDAANAVWQSLDGSVRIALWADRVKITAPLVAIEAPAVTMSGDLTVMGAITGMTDVIAGTISGKTHKHTGGTISGDTGVPI